MRWWWDSKVLDVVRTVHWMLGIISTRTASIKITNKKNTWVSKPQRKYIRAHSVPTGYRLCRIFITFIPIRKLYIGKKLDVNLYHKRRTNSQHNKWGETKCSETIGLVKQKVLPIWKSAKEKGERITTTSSQQEEESKNLWTRAKKKKNQKIFQIVKSKYIGWQHENSFKIVFETE